MSNTLNNKKKLTEDQIVCLVDLYNGIRIAQGWSIMTPEDAYPIIEGWHFFLQTEGIKSADYQKLLIKAVKYRTAEIREKKRPTPFSIELLLAMHEPQSIPSEYANRNEEMEARGFPKMNLITEIEH